MLKLSPNERFLAISLSTLTFCLVSKPAVAISAVASYQLVRILTIIFLHFPSLFVPTLIVMGISFAISQDVNATLGSTLLFLIVMFLLRACAA